MAAVAVPLAHAGHWLESAAFVLPPLLLIAMVVAAALVARRREAALNTDSYEDRSDSNE